MNLKFHSLTSALLAIILTFFITFIFVFILNSVIYKNFTPNNKYKNKINTPIVTYNDSYTQIFSIAPHNNKIIEFYDNELKKYIKDFVDAKDRYSIFKARIQYGLALGCINKELKNLKIDYWEESDNYRKNARNKYSTSPQKIEQSKSNESFLSENKKIFDFDLIKDINTMLLYPVNPQEKDFCTQLIPINEVYSKYMYLYMDHYDARNNYLEWYNSLKIFHPDYFEEQKRLEVLEKDKKIQLKEKQEERKQKYIEKRNEEKMKRNEENFIKLQKYIAEGKNIEARNEYGQTLLHIAVNEKNLKSIELLLKNGADMYARDRKGKFFYSPFIEAIYDLEILKLFLKYGVNVNYQYKKSETALTNVAKGCKNFELVELLLSNGADPNLIDIFGYSTKTGLFRYCKTGQDYNRMMKLLGAK